MPIFDARMISAEALVAKLELGQVAVFENERFELAPEEGRFLSTEWSRDGAKNISLRPGAQGVRGARGTDADLAQMAAMMARYAAWAERLVDRLVPRYRPGRTRGATSFRPCEIAGRVASWRQDDTRLHVDAFPSNPVRGRRILRVFTNVNPDGAAREWLLGEPFEGFAKRFFPRARSAMPGSAHLLRGLGITKSLRSDYDHFMLQLHDLAKGDEEYQRVATRERASFAAGTTWVVFTDQALHAATQGQHAFEQTFYVDVDRMGDRSWSPLAVLERLAGRPLAGGVTPPAS